MCYMMELEASASSGRAGTMGETTGHATGHTSFLGPRFERFVLGVLFLDPYFWAFSFLAFSFLVFRSWALLVVVLEVLD